MQWLQSFDFWTDAKKKKKKAERMLKQLQSKHTFVGILPVVWLKTFVHDRF